MTWSLSMMVEEHHIANICAGTWPWPPSLSQVFAAYVGEVLGHDARV